MHVIHSRLLCGFSVCYIHMFPFSIIYHPQSSTRTTGNYQRGKHSIACTLCNKGSKDNIRTSPWLRSSSAVGSCGGLRIKQPQSYGTPFGAGERLGDDADPRHRLYNHLALQLSASCSRTSSRRRLGRNVPWRSPDTRSFTQNFPLVLHCGSQLAMLP